MKEIYNELCVLFYNNDNKLIYVGKCERELEQRINEHKKDKPWFNEINGIKYIAFPSKDIMLKAEALLIQTHSPKYNKKRERLPMLLNKSKIHKEIDNATVHDYMIQDSSKEPEINKNVFSPKVELLDIDCLITSHMWQRELDESRSLSIYKSWNPDYCQIPDVILNSEGKYYVADGQHRIQSMRLAGIKKVLCRVIETDENPSSYFVGLNTNEPVDADIMFLQKANIDGTIEQKMLEILIRYNVRTSKPKIKDGFLYLKQIEDLTEITPMNLEVLEQTLELLSRSFCYSGPLTKGALRDTYTFLLKNKGAHDAITANIKKQQYELLMTFGASALAEMTTKEYPMKDISKHLIKLL